MDKELEQILNKIAKQIKTKSPLDVMNYIHKFGYENLGLTEDEKQTLDQYF